MSPDSGAYNVINRLTDCENGGNIATVGEGAAHMTTKLSKPASARHKSVWLTIGRFAFLTCLALAFFLLATSMVSHRFFRGGWIDQHGTLRP